MDKTSSVDVSKPYIEDKYKKREFYRDWLDLIYESIHNPENPNVNTNNKGVKRATELVSYENINPEEWEDAKFEASRRKVIKLEREEATMENAKNGILKGYNNQIIADITGLNFEPIEELRNQKED